MHPLCDYLKLLPIGIARLDKVDAHDHRSNLRSKTIRQ